MLRWGGRGWALCEWDGDLVAMLEREFAARE